MFAITKCTLSLFMLISASAFATPPKAVIFYFGGYEATTAEVDLWQKSALAQTGGDYQFNVYPYPAGASSSASSAIKGFGQGNINVLAKEIIDNASTQFIIVGHSSGCAIADAIAAGVIAQASTTVLNVRLVVLDGFLPSSEVKEKMPYKCYSAYDDGHYSLNWSAMKTCGNNFVPLETPYCGSDIWCLHFSLVNSAATSSIVKTIPEGYTDCVANLAWLND